MRNIGSRIEIDRQVRRRCPSIRDGFTLIEILTVLVLLTTMLAGTIGLLSLARESDRESQVNLFHRQELRRFADDFRSDAHSVASRSEVSVDEDRISIVASTGSKIVYQIRSAFSVTRSLEDSDGELVAADSYEIGTDGKIRIQWLEESGLIVWEVPRSGRSEKPIRIVAAVENTP